MRLDENDGIVAHNAAAAAIAPGEVRLDRIIADVPLRPDGVHLLAHGGQPVRAVVIPGPNGARDLLLMPLRSVRICSRCPPAGPDAGRWRQKISINAFIRVRCAPT